MQTSNDWYIGSMPSSRVENCVKWMRKAGLEVLNFRTEERVPVKVGKDTHYQIALRPMWPGYIFLRGMEAAEIADLPFAPRLLRAEMGYAVVRAPRMAHLQHCIGASEILREQQFQYIKGDLVRYKNFVGVAKAIKSVVDGQSLTIEYQALGKTHTLEVASAEVSLHV